MEVLSLSQVLFKFSYKIVFTLFILLLFNGSSRMMGIRQYRLLTIEEVNKMNKRWSVSKSAFILSPLDSFQITKRNEFKSNSTLFKALQQPLQMAFLSATKDSISLIVNCDVGGFPNLNWKSI